MQYTVFQTEYWKKTRQNTSSLRLYSNALTNRAMAIHSAIISSNYISLQIIY